MTNPYPVGTRITVTDPEGRTYDGEIVLRGVGGYLVEPLEGERVRIFVDETWAIEEIDMRDPVLVEAVATASRINTMILDFAKPYLTSVHRKEATRALTAAIDRLEDEMRQQGEDEGTIMLSVELSKIREALA
jgi:hypothetical protein